MTVIAVGRPNFDSATLWGQWWINELVKKQAQAVGMEVIDLYGADAVRSKYLVAMERAVYLSAVGHGNATVFTGQYQTYVFWYDDPETKRVTVGKHFNLLSCSVGLRLAPWMAEVGAVGVHAYTNVYTFWVSKFPNDIAKYFFQAHCETDTQLIAGKTHGEAHTSCKAKYKQYLDDPTVPSYIKADLLDDMNGKSFFGNPDAIITGPPPPPPETATIKGTVTEKEAGSPIQGAYVYAEETSTTTDSEGKYALTVVAPSTYTVKVVASGYQKQEKAISVEPNQEYTLDFQLEPTPTYIITVNSTPQGVAFKIPRGIVTPFTVKKKEGEIFMLDVPQKARVEGKTYFWSRWENGSRHKRRTIRMVSDMTVTAYYKLKSGGK